MMSNKFYHIFFISLCIYGFISVSAQTAVDTLSFTTPHGLIVIEGKMNGYTVPFVFDTGAGLSVSNDSVNETSKIKSIRKTIHVRDANEKKSSTPMVKVNSMRIGRFEQKNLKVISYDMPFLACHGSLLLGQDYIARYNWKFDFENKKVMLSKKPFLPENGFDKLPVSFRKYNTPFLTLKLQENPSSGWLIDFGYRGYMDIDKSLHSGVVFNPTYHKTVFETQTMGLLGASNKENVIRAQLDDLSVGNVQLNGIPADLDSVSSPKVGLYFFLDFCSSMILNHTTGEYWVSWKEKPELSLPLFDASPSWENGKLVVLTRRTDNLSTAANMPPSMVVEKINGIPASNFTSNCSWLSWKLGNEGIIKTLEGNNGQLFDINKIPFAQPTIKRFQ